MIINMNGAKAPETPSPVLQEKTVTPETLPTVIGADEGYDGLSQVTVNPDAQLKAENIRSGKTVFGVTGTFTGEEVHTESIFPVIGHMKNVDLSYSVQRFRALAKKEAVFGDPVPGESGMGRAAYLLCSGYEAPDRNLAIGYCQNSGYYYRNNFPVTLEALASQSITVTSGILDEKSICRINYTVFPIVVTDNVTVGNTFISYEIPNTVAKDFYEFNEELNINESKVTITIPDLPETTVYLSQGSSNPPTRKYYAYWVFKVNVMECM